MGWFAARCDAACSWFLPCPRRPEYLKAGG